MNYDDFCLSVNTPKIEAECLCRWERPYGRAFEVVMCELRIRALGLIIPPEKRVDWDTCTLKCGDGADAVVQLRAAYDNITVV